MLHIERSGGFANIRTHASVDMDALDPKVMAGLDEVLRAAAALKGVQEPGQPDRQSYKIQHGSEVMHLPESACTPTMLDVLDDLMEAGE